MSKIVSKKILSLIIFFVIVLILLFTGYKTLSDGFHIKNLKIGKITITQLYLKLDNKLILDVGKLDISTYFKTPSQNTTDIETFTKNIKYGIWAISYFEKLSVKEIILGDNDKASVSYDGKQYLLEFPNIQANFAIADDKKNIHLKIINLIFKNLKINTDGNIVYSTQTRKLGFNLIVSPLETKNTAIYLQGITDLKTLKLKAKTSEIKNIDFLKPYIETLPDTELQEWLFEKIKFSSLQINSLNVQANLDKSRFLSSIIENSNMKMTIKNPDIYLENNLEAIHSEQATLKLENEKVSIDLQKPTYDGISLEGSKLVLSNLTESLKLDISIIAKETYYKKGLKDLLANYNIILPLENISSPLDLNLELAFQFLQNSEPIVSVKGLIKAQDSSFSLYGIPLHTQSADVSLDITPQYKHVYIDTIHTRYQNIADIDTKITLDLDKDNLQANTSIHKLQINTNNDINTLPYQEPKQSQENSHSNTQGYKTHPIFPQQTSPAQILKRRIIDAIKAQLKDNFTKDVFYATAQNLATLDFDIDFSDPQVTMLYIQELGIEGSIDNGVYTININDLNKLYEYSPLLQYFALTDGNISISTNDFKNINFKTHLSNLNIPLYQKDGERVREISITGQINNEETKASSSDQNISLVLKGGQKNIVLKNFDFNLDEFLKSDMPAIKEMLENDNQTKLTQKQIDEETEFIREKRKYERLHNIEPIITNIESDNTTITYKTYQIPSDNINLRIQDGRVSADGTYKNGLANLDIIHGSVFIKANNFSGDFVNKILKTNIIKGGLYTLIGVYQNDIFNAELRLQNTLIKDFAVLQNIINFIDTIPSLIVFKNPNLGTQGYEIQKGKIIFAINQKYAGFENIHLVGKSMDIDGNGIIELDSKEINMSLTMSTIKNFSNIINKIPLVGYVILGKEGKISTNIIVNGTLDNPKTEITLAEDTIKAPFNILRRIFTPIDIIVDEIKNEMKK